MFSLVCLTAYNLLVGYLMPKLDSFVNDRLQSSLFSFSQFHWKHSFKIALLSFDNNDKSIRQPVMDTSWQSQLVKFPVLIKTDTIISLVFQSYEIKSRQKKFLYAKYLNVSYKEKSSENLNHLKDFEKWHLFLQKICFWIVKWKKKKKTHLKLKYSF